MSRPTRSRTTDAATWLLAAAVLGCAPGDDSAPPEAVPRATRGYVLISLDTLRADHLGCYGYERETSPFLDRLAGEAVLFERAYVQYPSTLTSHMSILTGLYPAEHGVYPPDSILPESVETLPQVFQRAGFRTAAFTEGGFLHARFGFRRGFDVFQARDRQGPDAVERTFERGLRFLRGLGDDERFFLFLHTYAVHAPYAPSPEHRALFWDGEPPADAFPPTGQELKRHNARGDLLTPEVRAYFTALYDAEIRHLDGVLDRFFAALTELGLFDDVTVVVTSDHGEELQDHGRMNHTQLYSEVLRVPLLLVHPDLLPGRIAEPVESVDLAPTLYELARLEPAAVPSGRSLARLASGRRSGDAGDAYAELLGGVWSLYRADDGRYLHLLVFDPPPRQWATRRLQLDIDVPSDAVLRFDVRSYQEERTLEIWDGGERLVETQIGPEWTPVEVKLRPGPRRKVLLSSPDCTEASESARRQCYSFQVRGVPLTRAELYDVAADPGETRDLAGAEASAVRSLYVRLGEYRARSGAGTETDELDEELRQRLEALGYLD